jgi:hypothetical protein
MDGRNSDIVQEDFYDHVTKEFNNSNFVPLSRILPDLHDDFAESMELPLSDDYSMTPDRAKALIASMKPRIAKMVTNYEQSGNGDGMLGGGDEDDDDYNDANPRNFDLCNCVAGDTRRSFLLPGDSSDLLYWWHVLEDAGMLQYTIAMLPEDVRAMTESAPSTMTNSSDKPGKDDNFLKNIVTLSRNWEEDNELKR